MSYCHHQHSGVANHHFLSSFTFDWVHSMWFVSDVPYIAARTNEGGLSRWNIFTLHELPALSDSQKRWCEELLHYLITKIVFVFVTFCGEDSRPDNLGTKIVLEIKLADISSMMLAYSIWHNDSIWFRFDICSNSYFWSHRILRSQPSLCAPFRLITGCPLFSPLNRY